MGNDRYVLSSQSKEKRQTYFLRILLERNGVPRARRVVLFKISFLFSYFSLSNVLEISAQPCYDGLSQELKEKIIIQTQRLDIMISFDQTIGGKM